MTTSASPADTTLRINRTFNAPREKVFSAWTDPEKLKLWWGAQEGFTTPIAGIDLKVGGSYRLGMKPPDQNLVFVVGGTYREVRQPEKLVFTWGWEAPLNSETMQPSEESAPPMAAMADTQDSLVTVEFREQGNDTEVVLTHQFFPSQEARDEHSKGWGGTFDKLALAIEAGEI